MKKGEKKQEKEVAVTGRPFTQEDLELINMVITTLAKDCYSKLEGETKTVWGLLTRRLQLRFRRPDLALEDIQEIMPRIEQMEQIKITKDCSGDEPKICIELSGAFAPHQHPDEIE